MDVVYLEVEDVLAAHERAVAHSGGDAAIRDAGLLESAVMAPRSGYFEFLTDIAAAYAVGIALNHPFIDGNKRSALASALLFLDLNGYELELGPEWEQIMLDVAAGKSDRLELSGLLANEMPDGIGVPLEGIVVD